MSDAWTNVHQSIRRHIFSDGFFLTCHQTNRMASGKQIRDEIMRMTIVVNSNPAQQEIYKLTEANRKFSVESTKLREERVKVGQSLGKNSQEYKDLTAKINSNSSSITENNKKIKELADTLDVTQMSVKQLKQEAILLRKELDRVVPGSNQYKALQDQLGAVNGRLAEVRGGAAATSSSFGSLASQFNHYSGIITAGVAMFVGFGLSIQNVIDRNNKLVDAQTAVAKTVNMTKEEVEDLTKTFSDFDTRTSKIDLLKIAETGGRLGIGKAQIKDFVQEVDKANVALGDGFAGGVEAVTNTLGKLKGLYSETKDLDMATAINQIGSAMNELGANGAASEQNIGEFALRLGSLPAKLKPTIAETLALGAAFEESGINAERSSTAYSTFIRNAAVNAAGFAKVMNISKKEVEDMMNTDPLEFFLKFSEGINGMDTTNLAKTMDFLKMNDQFVISTMGAASENTDKFRASIDLSNKSLKEATSLTNEFNKVNNNSAAIFDKVQKKFIGMFTSEAVAKTLNYWISTFGKFIGAVEDSDGTVTGFRNGLVFLIKVMTLMMVTMVSYNLLTGVYNTLMKTAYERVIGLTIVEKTRNGVMLISNGIATLYRATLWLLAAGYSLVTGNIAGATFAMRGFTAAIMANPLGAILSLIALVATAYFAFSESASDAAKKQKSFNEVMKEGTNNATAEIGALEVLYKTATNVKLSTEERLKAVQKLKAEFPGYFANISDEIIMNGKASKSYHELRSAIVASARAKAAQAELEKRAGDRFTEDETWKANYAAEWRELQILKKSYEEMKKTGYMTGNRHLEMLDRIEQREKRMAKMMTDGIAKKRQDQKSDEVYIKAISSYGEKAGLLTKPIDSEEATSSYTVPEPEVKVKKPKSTEAAERRHEKEMLDAERRGVQAEELARQIALNIEDAKIEAMEDGFEKELAALDLQEQRKLAEIDKQRVAQYEFDAIDKKIAKATGDDKALFEALKKSWTDNNNNLEKLKSSQTAIFDFKRKTLKVKYRNEDYKDLDEAFKRELSLLERQKNDELAGFQNLAELKSSLKGRASQKEIREIETWEQGKAALTKVYQKKEIEMQVAHMQTMLALYEGLDLSILTKDQQDQVLKFIDDAKNKIAELKAVQNSTTQGGKEKGSKSKLGGKGSTDILGMSLSDWDTFFTNIETGADKLGTIIAAVQAVQAAFGMYYQYVQANEQRQMQDIDIAARKKEKRFKQMLDRGQISQEQYERDIQKLNDQTELKKAKLEYEAAKRKRTMSIADVVINTAVAIMGIWKDFPKADFGATAAIMSGVVGALGLAQIATIAATPLPAAPGYEDGFGMEYNMRRSQDGKQFRVRRKRLSSGEVHSPTHFIAGERGTEMVIDSPTYTRFRPEVKRILQNEISYSRGYEGGFYRNNSGSGSSNNEEKLLMIIEQNTLAMREIKDKKFITHLAKDMDNAKEIIEMTEEFMDYKNSAKK